MLGDAAVGMTVAEMILRVRVRVSLLEAAYVLVLDYLLVVAAAAAAETTTPHPPYPHPPPYSPQSPSHLNPSQIQNSLTLRSSS